MTRSLIVTLFALFAIAAGPVSPAYAHHSFAATYREGQTIKIEGDVVHVLLRNPHSFVQVEVKEPNGTTVRYVAEWQAAEQLGSQGVTMNTLKAGDHVVISGAPGRDTAGHRILMTGLYRPRDKFSWSLHSSSRSYTTEGAQ